MRWLVAVTLAVLAGTALAGCGEPASSNGRELIVESAPDSVIEVDSATGETVAPTAAQAPKKEANPKTLGHIAGVVVDESIRPIEGASVRLPGLDLARVTDRDGGFGFVDLHPGPYYIIANATEYYAAESELAVDAEKFTRVKFVLKAIPPPEPRNFTLPFEGFTDVTEASALILNTGYFCNTCTFQFYAGGPGFRGMVIEGYMDGYAGAGAGGLGSNSFYHYLYDAAGSGFNPVSRGAVGNPFNMVFKANDLIAEEEHSYSLEVNPRGFPAPEFSKKFHIYVTQFFNQDPPPGWSFLATEP